MPNYHILMGDIIASRTYKASALSRGFRRIVSSCNQEMADGILSHNEKECPVSNSYFVVGNLLSILFAMVCAIVAEIFWGPFSL